MGEVSKISWTDATFNPWWGCTKVSDGCKLCYAETFSKRFGHNIWGPNSDRRLFSSTHWEAPRQWNEKYKNREQPYRVFCGSMCDILEDRRSLDEPRAKLWKLIEDTPNLIWLLLTKRPENAERLFPERWVVEDFPGHVWLGVSVETFRQADRLSMIAELSVHRFVSVEPMLDMTHFRNFWWAAHWIICGGESGSGCRPFDLKWARMLRERCQDHEIPFFMKQLGGFPDKRDRIEEWPEELRVQDLPEEMKHV